MTPLRCRRAQELLVELARKIVLYIVSVENQAMDIPGLTFYR